MGTTLRTVVGLSGLLAVLGCASTSAEQAGFYAHHRCYNRITFALYFGDDADLRSLMTDSMAENVSPETLLTQFDERVGRGHVPKGRVTNIDGILREDEVDQPHRVLFIPWDADKAAYIMLLKNTRDGCRLDRLTFR